MNTFTFIDEDGERRRRRLPASPSAVYDRLGYLHAVEGMAAVIIDGAEYSVACTGPALVGAILRAAARRTAPTDKPRRGRPALGDEKRIPRSMKASNAEWTRLKARAAEAGMSASAYIRDRCC